MSNLLDGLREHATAYPDRTALITADGHRISHATLDRLIDRAARHLSAAGVRPGQLVGLSVAGPDEAMALVFYLALARLGVASAERATQMALDAIQILGGNGYINEFPAGRLLRDAKLYEIGAGTSEIRRMLIGRELFNETR